MKLLKYYFLFDVVSEVKRSALKQLIQHRCRSPKFDRYLCRFPKILLFDVKLTYWPRKSGKKDIPN